MSAQVSVAWDRPKTSGDDAHWLALTISGLHWRRGNLAAAILLDTSSSMVGDRLRQARRGIATVIERLEPQDRVAVWTFDSEVRPVFAGPGGSQVPALSGVKAGGRTRLDLGIEAAAAWLRSQPGRPHLIVLTDGDPTDGDGRRVSGETIRGVVRGLGQEGIRVVSVGIGSAGGYDASFLRELADLSGGRSLAAVAPQQLVSELLACVRATSEEGDDVQVEIEGSALELVQGWRVEPRVQPLAVEDGRRIKAPGSGDMTLLLQVCYRAPIGTGRGPGEVGRVRVSGVGLGEALPLTLDHVAPTSAERMALNVEVDRLRARVALAQASALRSKAEDPEDQLRLTRQLRDLAAQACDPRMTQRLDLDLARLVAGDALTADDDARLVETARDGRDHGATS